MITWKYSIEDLKVKSTVGVVWRVGSDFIIFLGVSVESWAGLGVGKESNDSMVHGFEEQWLCRVFLFSSFLLPLAASPHCSPAPVGAGDSEECKRKQHFAPY